MYKGGNHIALTEQDKKLLEEYERITERNVISITIDEEKTSGITDSKFGGIPYIPKIKMFLQMIKTNNIVCWHKYVWMIYLKIN